MAYNQNQVTTDVDLIRLLTNDTAPDLIYSDTEITAFLTLEGGSVKLAAAQILDTIADDELLTSKVIKDHDLETDGAKLADSLRKRAAALRAQVATELGDDDDGVFFGIVSLGPTPPPELTEWPYA